MSDRFWLFVEGTNFDTTIFDTDDLATIRGASWALLEMPGLFPSAIEHASGGALIATPIFTGASQGLYEVVLTAALPEGSEVEAFLTRLLVGGRGFRAAIDAALARAADQDDLSDLSAALEHMRFTFGIVPADDFPTPNDEAMAALRRAGAFRQYRTIDVDLPPLMSATDRDETLTLAALVDERNGVDIAGQVNDRTLPSDWPCAIDQIRPRADFAWRSADQGPIRDVPVSSATATRKTFGRWGRRALFYEHHASPREEIKTLLAGKNFADSFEEIAADRDKPPGVPESTFRKIAVLAMDGNAFTKIRDLFVSAATGRSHGEALADYSKAMVAKRSALLGGLIRLFAENRSLQLRGPSKPRTDTESARTKVLRFETLLWGADESVLVFPAWAVEDVLKCLETLLRGEVGRLSLPDGREANLSYAVGVVLCNFKTPIRLARKLADDLCASAKQRAKLRTPDPVRMESIVDLMVLAGVDVPARSLVAERDAVFRVPKDEQGGVFPFPLFGAGEMLDAFVALKGIAGDREAGVPRARLSAILEEALAQGTVGKTGAQVDSFVRRLEDLLGQSRYRNATTGEPFGPGFLSQFLMAADGAVSASSWRVPLAPLLHLMELWNFIGFAGAEEEIMRRGDEGEAA